MAEPTSNVVPLNPKSSPPVRVSATAFGDPYETFLGFCRLVLPARGPFLATRKLKTGGFATNQYADTHAELWELVKDYDASGWDAYYLVASVKEARNNPPKTTGPLGRSGSNIARVKCFRLDVDAGPGPGKPYEDREEALTALAQFIRATGSPRALAVGSGPWGVHAYWPLIEELDPEEWKIYAEGLKALSHEHGLEADHGCTADASRVLRPPGTHNHKQTPPTLVEVDADELESFTPYPLAAFADWRERGEKRLRAERTWQGRSFKPDPRFQNRPAYLKSFTFKPGDKSLIDLARVWPPKSGEAIAEECGQLRELRDRQGMIPEPPWHAGLGVLAFCTDGKELAHLWSSGDPRYTAGETDERLARVLKFGPTTCAKFHEVNPAVCEACPHWGTIRSPINLVEEDELISARGTGGEGTEETENDNPVYWPEITKAGTPTGKNYPNALVALKQLKLECDYDLFHDWRLIDVERH
jgi:hypothetical protein